MYEQVGRASVPSERLLKASLLIALYSVRRERASCDELEYNLPRRWCLDMDLLARRFDATVFTKNRQRWLAHDAGHPSVDFRRERRSKETHPGTTEPEAHLLRKGPGKEARPAFPGHALTGTATACRWTSRSAGRPARPSGMRRRSSWTGFGNGAAARARPAIP